MSATTIATGRSTKLCASIADVSSGARPGQNSILRRMRWKSAIAGTNGKGVRRTRYTRLPGFRLGIHRKSVSRSLCGALTGALCLQRACSARDISSTNQISYQGRSHGPETASLAHPYQSSPACAWARPTGAPYAIEKVGDAIAIVAGARAALLRDGAVVADVDLMPGPPSDTPRSQATERTR
jgi:hypothetical protein